MSEFELVRNNARQADWIKDLQGKLAAEQERTKRLTQALEHIREHCPHVPTKLWAIAMLSHSSPEAVREKNVVPCPSCGADIAISNINGAMFPCNHCRWEPPRYGKAQAQNGG
jgi:hypothetical protein